MQKKSTVRHISHTFCAPAAGTAGALALAIRSAVINSRLRRQRDFIRTLETVLQPRETVKEICPNGRQGRWILTSKRLLMETKEGFLAVPFKKIRSLHGVDRMGKSTSAPARMTKLMVKGEQEYTLFNTDEAFIRLVKQLKQYKAKAKRKK